MKSRMRGLIEHHVLHDLVGRTKHPCLLCLLCSSICVLMPLPFVSSTLQKHLLDLACHSITVHPSSSHPFSAWSQVSRGLLGSACNASGVDASCCHRPRWLPRLAPNESRASPKTCLAHGVGLGQRVCWTLGQTVY